MTEAAKESTLSGLHPSLVWAHFATLCAIPRPSYREEALKQNLSAWADAHGIAHFEDAVGNLILQKPASPGCESAPGVILQGHLDMVCQANAGTVHDFERDAIRTVVREGWVVAENTTLGADNGIGVALALAALEAEELEHPALEVLLTINEESGMDGARGLAPGTLQGQVLINLDTEEWGHFYLGCAGGVDVEVRHISEMEALPQDYEVLRFDVSGLRGGHSGIDIHLGRGNAIKLLAEALRDLAAHTDVRLIEMQGGSARNAIPREAFAICAVPAAAVSGIDEWVEHRLASWQHRFTDVDAGISFRYELDEMPVGQAVISTERDYLLGFLDNVVNGVSRISDDFAGVTDTSSNLGVFKLMNGESKVTFKVRSLLDARADVLADKLVSFASGYGLRAYKDGAYPGWTPNPASPLLVLCQQVYEQQFGAPASLQVIHAGLECGLLAASHPHLDMISFGPDIRGAHAPGEKVEITSVAHCWELLQAVLRALAKPAG
ncbi:MAG: beta-Ala-His dipeptidase [Gammaproteobacteria bacterium]|nr:beta-Ala-His dipeptidase [Gammaproteobacteria bacterium]MBU1623581.1 beta-Ala-His dipeptidase [Gammaproteobacteria bacterium]